MFSDVSPSSISLIGEPNSPLLRSFNMNKMKNKLLLEGEIIRRSNENKFKKYWYRLLGNELCGYKSKEEKYHKSMHILGGVYLKDESDEQLDIKTTLFTFTLIFPGNKPRAYFFQSKDDKEKWMEGIKKVIC